MNSDFLAYSVGALSGIAASASFFLLMWQVSTRELRANLKLAKTEAANFEAAYRNIIAEDDNAFLGGPSTTELCGGCGHYLTPIEIATCPGQLCDRFIENAKGPKKINTGFNSFLQT